jgi:hypothetical protein
MRKLSIAFGLAVALTAMVTAVIAQDGPNTKAHPNTPTDNWQHDMLWSWGDSGLCEAVCIKPPKGSGGRLCLMTKFACDAAAHKFDTKAWEITMATQAHIDWRKGRLQEAGETAVAGFLRSYFKCQ